MPTPPPPRAVLFQHDHPVGAGGLEAALADAGFALEPRFREVRPGDADAELVVVLGGFMGASPESLTRAGRSLEALTQDDLPRLAHGAERIHAFRHRLALHLRERVAAHAGAAGAFGL